MNGGYHKRTGGDGDSPVVSCLLCMLFNAVALAGIIYLFIKLINSTI